MRSTFLFVLLLFSVLSHGQVAIEEYEPRYPTYPVCVDDSGEISLSFFILENGKPHKIEVESTDSLRFLRTSIKTLMKYEFQKGTFNVNEKYFKSFNFQAPHVCSGH